MPGAFSIYRMNLYKEKDECEGRIFKEPACRADRKKENK